MTWAFRNKTAEEKLKMAIFKLLVLSYMLTTLYISFFYSNNIRHFSLLNANAAGACGYDFLCDGGRLVRAYVRLRRGAM